MFFSGVIIEALLTILFPYLSNKAAITVTMHEFCLVIGSSNDNYYLSTYVVSAMQWQGN